MGSETPTLDSFLKDVADHKMTVLHAAGNLRHIRFAKPGTNCYSFNIITWPGSLCIEGDCGTYVFSRLHDMFEFFRARPRNGELAGTHINPSYWAEKVEAQSKNGGVYEWDKACFIERTVEYVREHFRDRSKRDQLDCFREVRQEVLCAETEEEAYRSLNDFHHVSGFEFQDIWEWRMKKYTYRFIWNLRAIAWAINKFDEETKA